MIRMTEKREGAEGGGGRGGGGMSWDVNENRRIAPLSQVYQWDTTWVFVANGQFNGDEEFCNIILVSL